VQSGGGRLQIFWRNISYILLFNLRHGESKVVPLLTGGEVV
jgi:hypothetical protein